MKKGFGTLEAITALVILIGVALIGVLAYVAVTQPENTALSAPSPIPLPQTPKPSIFPVTTVKPKPSAKPINNPSPPQSSAALPTPEPTPTPIQTQSQSTTPAPTPAPTPTPVPTPTPAPTPAPTPTPTPTPAPTPAPTPTPTPTPTPEPVVQPVSKSGISYQVTDIYFYQYADSAGFEKYFGYVEITNTGNSNIYMDNCTFDLEDNNGHLLQSDNLVSSCPDIIAPGEKGYFYSGALSSYIDDGVSLANGVNFKPNFELEEARGYPVDYIVSDDSIREGTWGYPKIVGRVTNNSGEDDPLFYIEVILYDKSGKIIGITGTNITEFNKGKTASFEISCIGLPESVTMQTVGNYKIVARAAYYQF